MIITATIFAFLLTPQAELDDKVTKLREELRRTVTNSSLMMSQAKSQQEEQKIYERGYASFREIATTANGYEKVAKTIDQQAKFGLIRYEAMASMLTNGTESEKLALSFVQQYRDSATLCQSVEELLFYRFTGSDSHSRIEEILTGSKNLEVLASASLAKLLKALLAKEGDPNMLRTLGIRYEATKAGKRALRMFNIRTQLALGRPMPDLELTPVGSKPAKLSALRGKVVMLDFWGYWSSVCNGERAELREIVKRHAGKMILVGVNTDEWNPSFLQTRFKADGITWPNHLSSLPTGSLPVDLGITDYPSKIIIDSQGIVRYLPGVGNWRDTLDLLLK
jgi:thiol-disulfide isomerase/thioredoxin